MLLLYWFLNIHKSNVGYYHNIQFTLKKITQPFLCLLYKKSIYLVLGLWFFFTSLWYVSANVKKKEKGFEKKLLYYDVLLFFQITSECNLLSFPGLELRKYSISSLVSNMGQWTIELVVVSAALGFLYTAGGSLADLQAVRAAGRWGMFSLTWCFY